MHGQVPAAGQNNGLAGKEESGKAFPELAQRVSLWFLVLCSWSMRLDRALITKTLDLLELSHSSGRENRRSGLGSENKTHGLDYSQELTLILVTALSLCEAVLLKTWDILRAWPDTSTAPWTPGWAENLCHTASFSHFLSNVYILQNLLFWPYRCQATVVASLHPFNHRHW